MRAREFITERRKPTKKKSKNGKITKRQQMPTTGLHKFRDGKGMDRIYELNKVMAAAASTDGTFVPDVAPESWSGRFNTAHPYTEVEQNMLKKAFQSIGTEFHDLNHGDLKSQELDSTEIQSPVKAFKGFKSVKSTPKKSPKKK